MTCTPTPAIALDLLYSRIRGVLTAYLPAIVDAAQAHLPSDLRIVGNRVQVHVGVDLISIAAQNPEDQHPLVTVYPTLSTDTIDVTDRTTVTASFIVEATGGAAVGDAGWSAQQAQVLAQAASEALQTHLPTPGLCGLCIYDARLRSTLAGAPRQVFPRTTWTLWAARTALDVYYRTSYGWEPSRLSTDEFRLPTNPTQGPDEWDMVVTSLVDDYTASPSIRVSVPAVEFDDPVVFSILPIVDAYETRTVPTAPTGTLATTDGQVFSMTMTPVGDEWQWEVPSGLTATVGESALVSIVINGRAYVYIVDFA